MQSLKHKALAAYAEQKLIEQREGEARLAESTEATRKAFEKFFGVEPDSVSGVYATKDDIRFWIHPETYNTRFYFQVQGVCPTCGGAAWSTDCYTLNDLGRMLNEFQVNFDEYQHRHLANNHSEKSLGEQLQDLILDIVQHNSPLEF